MIPADDVHVMSVSLKLCGDPRKCTYEATYLQRLRVHAGGAVTLCDLHRGAKVAFVVEWKANTSWLQISGLQWPEHDDEDSTRILKEAEANARGKACACTHSNSTALEQSAMMATCGSIQIFAWGN